MPVKLVFLRKRLITLITFKRFVSFVNSLMILKMRVFDKCLVAESTLIRPDACHASVMIALALFVSKDFAAHVTLVPFRIL